jgi:hypothetical protein
MHSKEMREYTEKISKTVKYYELAADEDFQDEYIKSLHFPHSNLENYLRTVELLRRLGRTLKFLPRFKYQVSQIHTKKDEIRNGAQTSRTRDFLRRHTKSNRCKVVLSLCLCRVRETKRGRLLGVEKNS